MRKAQMIRLKEHIETPNYKKHRCKDFDEDCFGLDHLHCWLYDPTQGMCPFLKGLPDEKI